MIASLIRIMPNIVKNNMWLKLETLKMYGIAITNIPAISTK
jgi:hypothetical protein